MYDENPVSRIPNSNYKTLEGLKAELAQQLNIHITIPYKARRPTLHLSTATSEGKKKPPVTKTSSENPVVLKKIKESAKESKKEYLAPPPMAKKKLTKREKSADYTRESQQVASRGSILPKSQKVRERADEEEDKEEAASKAEERRINKAACLPPIEKRTETVRKAKQSIRRVKVKIIGKQADLKKLGKTANTFKKGDRRKESRKTKHNKVV